MMNFKMAIPRKTDQTQKGAHFKPSFILNAQKLQVHETENGEVCWCWGWGGGALPIDPGDLTLVMRIQRLYYYGNSATQ